MTRRRTIGWTLCGLLLGVLIGFGGELLRRQPASKVEQRYIAPPSSDTTDAAPPAPGASDPSSTDPSSTDASRPGGAESGVRMS